MERYSTIGGIVIIIFILRREGKSVVTAERVPCRPWIPRHVQLIQLCLTEDHERVVHGEIVGAVEYKVNT